jgi:cytochrome c oxidase subunit 2
MTIPLLPAQASTTAVQVDFLFWALTLLTAVIMVVIFGPMFYFLFKYRRGKIVDRVMPDLPTNRIEITWTVIPLVIMIGIFIWGASIYYSIARVPPDAVELHVIGKQWMWKIQHPEGNREINQLHVPVGQTIKLVLASQDVIHSFFLPAFRIKQDVLPGRYRTEWFRATKPGVYHLFCAEFCGTAHARMVGELVVMPPDEYARWLASGRPSSSLVQDGERLFRELGCSGCHMGSTQIRAPRLEGLFGKPVALQGGQIVRADEKYIRDSILLPNQQITAGYEPLMPTFQGHISEEELLQIISYIKTLGPQFPEERK